MSNQTPHSPLPWTIADGVIAEDMVHFAITAPKGGFEWMVASVSPMRMKRDIDAANAELICKAVNSHDAIVNALKKSRAWIESTAELQDTKRWEDLLQEIDAAIALTEPEQPK